MALAACANPFNADVPTNREIVEEYQAQNPDFVVPTELPTGYRMLSPQQYLPVVAGTLPIIEVCVPEAGAPILGTCVGTDDRSPWFETQGDGRRVVVQTMSAPETTAALDPWRSVEFTSDWESLTWLDQASI